jgi:3-keto-disaccharide hydrolase
MRHPRIRWAVIASAFFLLGINDMSNHAISFENAKIGATPEGWTSTLTGSGDPKWTIESDRTAPSKLTVLRQSGRATYPLILKNDTNIKDGFVEVKFKAIAGSGDRAAGIVWRAKDANNYYVVRANALEDNVVLYKTVKGTRSSLDIVGRKGGYGVKTAVPSGTWHTLRIDFKGSRFSVSFNGNHLFEVEDTTFTGAGKVGLWTKADSVTLFDEVTYGETK